MRKCACARLGRWCPRGCTRGCGDEARRKHLLLSPARPGSGVSAAQPPRGDPFPPSSTGFSCFGGCQPRQRGRAGAGQRGHVRACPCARFCIVPRPTLCQRCRGAASYPADPHPPLAAAPSPPKAVTGRPGGGVPVAPGWHRAPRPGESPTFLTRLQVEQWAGAGWGCRHAECAPVCQRVGQSGGTRCPMPPPSATPRWAPGPRAGIVPGPWHRFGLCRIRPTRSPSSASALCTGRIWQMPRGQQGRAPVGGLARQPAVPCGTPRVGALSSPQPRGRVKGWVLRMLHPNSAPQSGAARLHPPQCIAGHTGPTHRGVAMVHYGVGSPGGARAVGPPGAGV